MREEFVDHRRLGDERGEPHGPATRRARERVDLDDLLEQGRQATCSLGRRRPRRGATVCGASVVARSVALSSGRDAVLVMLNLPLALIGGVAGVFVSGGVISIASILCINGNS